jgi:hypothetical protein
LESRRTLREVAAQGKNTATQKLLGLLRVACVILVTAKFNGDVTSELQLSSPDPHAFEWQ